MGVAVNEREISDRGGCGNEGVHCGEAFLAGLPDLPRTRGGVVRERFDGNDLCDFFPVRFKRGLVAERAQARPEFDLCDAGNRRRIAVVLKQERNLIRSRLVKIVGDNGRTVEEVGHWRKVGLSRIRRLRNSFRIALQESPFSGLYEFPNALCDQFSDRILPFDKKMATAPPKRFDRLLAGWERSGPEFPRGVQGPVQSRSR